MRLRERLADELKGRLDDNELRLLPSGMQIVGDIAVLSLRPELEKHKTAIGETTIKLFPRLRTACMKIDAVKGEMRRPSVAWLAGDGTETLHHENGCAYKLDIAKVMFSKGNVRERGRIAALVKGREAVVDMFAGIGYFSIPIAKSNPGASVHSLELNPDAFRYLKENIRLNRLPNIEALNCDNRAAPERLHGTADRVLMGYFNKDSPADKFLPYAFKFLKTEGGVIHYHGVYHKDGLWQKPLGLLEKEGMKAGYRLNRSSNCVVVKSYSPGMVHVVVDAGFKCMA